MNKIISRFMELYMQDDEMLKSICELKCVGEFLYYKKTENNDLYFAKFLNNDKKISYNVSIDFIDKENPKFRCNCHSRVLPCKHSIALLQSIDNNIEFENSKLPDDIAKKREIIERNKEILSDINKNNPKSNPKNIKKINKLSPKEKAKLQLQGLDEVEIFINNILEQGVLAVEIQSLKKCREMSKNLEKYQLFDMQKCLNNLIDKVENIKKRRDDKYYVEIISNMVQLNKYINTSRLYLQDIINGNITNKYTQQSYKLGMELTFEELKELDIKEENVDLLNIGLCTRKFQTAHKYVDTAYFFNVNDNKIVYTSNDRLFKSKKYVVEQDVNFNVMHIEKLYYYPQNSKQRVYINDYTESKHENIENIENIRGIAKDINYGMNKIKRFLKNTFVENAFPVLIDYDKIGVNQSDELILIDKKGRQININNNDDMEFNFNIKIENLRKLPNKNLYKNQVLFGEMYYDYGENKFSVLPLSIIAEKEIIHL